MVNDHQAPPTGAEQRLQDHRIQLPPVPTPLGAYAEVVQTGSPLSPSRDVAARGWQARLSWAAGCGTTVEDGRKAAAIACLNVLSAVRRHVGSLDKVSRVVRLGVSIATAGDFREHPKVADAASDVLVHVFGEEHLSTRIVLGVASLPLGMPVELELILEVTP